MAEKLLTGGTSRPPVTHLSVTQTTPHQSFRVQQLTSGTASGRQASRTAEASPGLGRGGRLRPATVSRRAGPTRTETKFKPPSSPACLASTEQRKPTRSRRASQFPFPPLAILPSSASGPRRILLRWPPGATPPLRRRPRPRRASSPCFVRYRFGPALLILLLLGWFGARGWGIAAAR